MKLQITRNAIHLGRLFKAGTECDVDQETGAALLKNGHAESAAAKTPKKTEPVKTPEKTEPPKK